MILGGPQLSPGHTIARTGDELGAMAREMQTARERGFDFETNGLRYGNGDHPVGYSIGYLRPDNRPRVWYVPVAHQVAEAQANPDQARLAFKDALAGSTAIIGHNLGFDLNMGRANGYEIPEEARVEDTFIQAYLIYERRALNLEALSEDIVHQCAWSDSWEMKRLVTEFLQRRATLRRMRYKKDDKEAGEAAYLTTFGHSEVPVGLEAEYSCRDTAHALLLDQYQRDKAMGAGTHFEQQRRYLYWNEMLLVRALADMQFVGQPVDAPYLRWLADDIEKRLATMERQLSQLFGASINWRNDNEVRDLLYGHLKLPVVRLTERGQIPAVDRTALLMLRPHQNGMTELAEFNAWLKARQTYTLSLAWYVDRDGRIRANFNQAKTKSGRLSSDSPNLQNIPVRHAATSKRIRKAFTVPEGMSRVYGDYSQIELRYLAWSTDCANLRNAYLSPAYDAYCRDDLDYDAYVALRQHEPKRDVHGDVARATFGIDDPKHPDRNSKPCDCQHCTDWKRKRRAGKIIGFGTAYGMGPPGLMGNPELMLSQEEAEEYFAAYHRGHPEINWGKRRLFDKMLSMGRVPYFVNWAGRACHEPLLKSPHNDLRSEGERSAFASMVQGSAGELTRFSLVSLYLARREGRIQARASSTVHDEIQLDCLTSDAAHTARETQRHMEAFKGLVGRIPVIVDLESSETTWADKRELPYAEYARTKA